MENCRSEDLTEDFQFIQYICDGDENSNMRGMYTADEMMVMFADYKLFVGDEE